MEEKGFQGMGARILRATLVVLIFSSAAGGKKRDHTRYFIENQPHLT
jgi:hypothetical protein